MASSGDGDFDQFPSCRVGSCALAEKLRPAPFSQFKDEFAIVLAPGQSCRPARGTFIRPLSRSAALPVAEQEMPPGREAPCGDVVPQPGRKKCR